MKCLCNTQLYFKVLHELVLLLVLSEMHNISNANMHFFPSLTKPFYLLSFRCHCTIKITEHAPEFFCTSHTRPLWILVYMRQTTSNCGVYSSSNSITGSVHWSRSIAMTGTDDSRSSISLNSSR